MRKYIDTDDGRTSYERAQDIYSEAAGLPDDIEAKEIGIPVWENAVATKTLPCDLFKGVMDARYEVSEDCQTLAFIGERRSLLGVSESKQ